MAAVVESFVSDYLLGKLVAFTEEKVVMIAGVKDELKKLERRMRRVGAFLKDAEVKRITDESVNNWLNELKDVMYDADDMIDLWRFKKQSLPPEEPSSSSISPTCCPFPLFSCFHSISLRHEIAQQIKTLNIRLDEIFKDMASLNLQHIQSEVRVVGRMDARVSSPVIEADIVGSEIEEGANKLVKMVVIDNKKKFNLIAITGMGGIGKTTLAQKIYNSTTIKNSYAERIWLSVSQSKSPSQLIKVAIRNIGGNPGNAKMESELLLILADAISGKSFFLVLDDVWNPDQSVNLLQNALKSTATYGFILVTTRDQRVAMKMGATYIHQVNVLSPKSGWELLCKRAYLTDIDDIKNLEEVGTKIVGNCGGLPLAIKTIGGMLATKNKSKTEWNNILKSSSWSISGLPQEIDRALLLSYEDLSPQLKQCFLYCSLYPQDVLISRYYLIRFWMAEGLVEERNNQIMESTAEDYYHELIRRHLLEPDHIMEFADQSRCRMHDLLRSLAQYLSKEESFVADGVLPDPDAMSRLRRLSIEEANERISIPGPPTEPLRLRSFIISKCLSQIENHTFVRLKHLRVLHINEKGLNNIPESIGDMIHLRLLDLNNTSISTIPESIGLLINLLFLSLKDCELLHALPRGITRLCNLQHLNLQRTPLTFVPKGLGRLKKLTQIWGFQIVGDDGHDEDKNGWDLKELEGLSQLRRMSISKLERAKDVFVMLTSKKHLIELKLIYTKVIESSGHEKEQKNENSTEILEKLCPPLCIEDLQIKHFDGKTLPRWMSLCYLGDLLPNLQYLHLVRWSCCTDLPPLGLLPNLKYLRVKGASAIVRISSEFLGMSGWKGPNVPTAFPKLEFLILRSMPNLEEWVLSDFKGEDSISWQLMPRIKQLAIENCPKLRALPEGLQQLTTVKELIVRETHNIRSIQTFSFECEKLLIENNQCLEILSNLPGVKRLEVGHIYNLACVSRLDSLESILLVDYRSEGLPKWLVTLMEERKGHSTDKLHLDLFCRTTLLERCLKEGPDWPIIKCFSSVSAYNKEKTAYLEYIREPESYFANL
jgi:Leucine-rich repeat (LRR) protein